MSQSYIQGTVVQFYTSEPFTDIEGTAVDPDEVVFGFEVQGQNTVSWTYIHGTGDNTGTIVRDGVGLYHANIDTTNYTPGTWEYAWACYATSLDADSTRTQTRQEQTVIITPKTVDI